MPEYFTVVDLADVSGIRIECRTCQAAVSLPLTPTQERVNLPGVCPGCRADWSESTEHSAVQSTMQLVGAMRSRWEELRPAFNVRFEITNDTDEGSKDDE